MREWFITGLEGLSDDFGLSEPSLAAEEVRSRFAAGEQLTERDVEDIADKYHCWVSWKNPTGDQKGAAR